jgi:hypothetical protein
MASQKERKIFKNRLRNSVSPAYGREKFIRTAIGAIWEIHQRSGL